MNAIDREAAGRAGGHPDAARRRPAARAVCAGCGVRRRAWWRLVGDRRHRLLVVHRGPLHREHRQCLRPGRHRRAWPAHRGRRGRHQGGRQPARPCRRSADRARSRRLAGPSGPGHGLRRRGDCRGRDGAAPGRPAAGDDRCGAGSHRPGAGRADAGQRRCDAIRLAGCRRLGVAPVQRPGDRRCAQGQRRRGLGAGPEGSGANSSLPCFRPR